MTETPPYPTPTTYSRIIARMLGLQERELPRLLEGTGLDTSILLPGDESFISGEQQVRIMENGRRLRGRPGFGLQLGQQLGPAAHGPVGYLALASPDLFSSLQAFCGYLPARLPIVDLRVVLDQTFLICSYQILVPVPDFLKRNMSEAFSVAVQAVTESILRREVSEGEFFFEHEAPHYESLYREYLHGSFQFGCDQVIYRLPESLAQTPNSAGDSAGFALARELCQKLLEQVPANSLSIADRVRTLLLSQPQGSVNETDVARALFISKRTLARRLEQEQTSYRDIREETLEQLARSSLLEPGQTVESVAALLGYHDSAAFRKAFRRWTATTPSEYRSKHYAGQ